MPRTARIVVENIPYHVTQRGNRRQEVFFCDGDRRQYLSWLHDYADRHDLEILAYCIMGNHVHLIVVPRTQSSIAKVMQVMQMRYTQMVNARLDWTGHLWQGRFYSTALDEPHLWAAVRYVELNPVRAGLVSRASDYPWSSAAFHLGLKPDRLIRSETEWGGPVEGWAEALSSPEDEQTLALIRARTHTGFPCGSENFLSRMSAALGRELTRRPVGRPRREK